jgi:hypothetical protein
VEHLFQQGIWVPVVVASGQQVCQKPVDALDVYAAIGREPWFITNS